MTSKIRHISRWNVIWMLSQLQARARDWRVPGHREFGVGWLGLEILFRLMLIVITIIIQAAVKPHKITRYWTDVQQVLASYGHPQANPETVRPYALLLICILPALTVPVCLVLLVELQKARKRSEVGARLEIALTDLIPYSLGISGSLISVCLWVEVIKRYIGRPRPDFLSRCFASGDPLVLVKNLKDASNLMPYGDLPCASTDTVDEGRLSFPSGHSAISTATFVYLALWFNSYLRKFRFFRSFVIVMTVVSLLIPLVISFSRLRDHRHHPTDVLAGIVLGGLSSIVFHRVYEGGITLNLFANDRQEKDLLQREQLSGANEPEGSGEDEP